MENNVNQEEETGKKKWLLLLLLFLLFLLVVIITIIFVRDNGEAVATSKENPGFATNESKGIDKPEGNIAGEASEDNEVYLDVYAGENGLTKVIRLSTAKQSNQEGALLSNGENPGGSPAGESSSSSTPKVPVTVNGLDKEFFNESVKIEIEGSGYTAKLTDSEGNTTDYTSGTEITEDGEYTLEIIESDGTVTEYHFVIDTIAPSITGVENGKIYKSATPSIVENNLEKVVLTKDGKEVKYNIGDTITEEGTYVLTVTDKAGNVTEVEFTVDNTAPVVKLYKYNKKHTGAQLETENWYTFSLEVEATDANIETVKLIDNNGNEKDYTNRTEIGGRANYTLTATDKAGNSTTITFGIDKDKPKISGVENNKYYNKDVTPKISDLNLEKVTVTKDGEEITYTEGMTFSDEGNYKIEATDKAGNTRVVEFTIDKTAPTAEMVEIKNINQVTPGYAKAGDKIWVYLRVSEHLSVEPTITINGVTAKIVQTEDGNNFGADWYKYVGEVVMTEEMVEGKIEFIITGYKDFAENEGKELTNKDINYGPVQEIILDYTAPAITFDNIVNGVIKQGTSKTVTDASPFTTVISNEEGKELKTRSSELKNGKYYDRFNIGWLGEGTFTVTATDVAGNVSTVTFKVDGTAPAMKQLSMANEQKVTAGYAKAGDSIWVYVLFNEKLSVEPEVKINGVVATKKYDYVDDTQQQYVGAVTMTTDMKEGEIEFTVSGYKDLVGNEGSELTQESLTEGTPIILDYTAPTITTPRNPTEIRVYDVNPYKVVRVKDEKTVTIWEQKVGGNYSGLGWLPEGTYTIIATDVAGNETKFELKIDKTAPTVQTLGMMNINQLDTGYAKAGDHVWVYAIVSEHLSVEPTITINGETAKIVQTEDGNKFGADWYKYVGEVVMTEEMTQGEIQFTVSGYKDLVGNEGESVDNTKINKGPNKIILDTIKPEITVTEQVNVVIRDANKFSTTWKNLNSDSQQGSNPINDGFWGGAWQTSFGFSWIKDNKFKVNVTATDVAGNVETKEWEIDVTAPVCTSLEIENKNQATGYAKAEDVIKVNVGFNEELEGNPTIKVNNTPASVTLVEGKYIGEVKMQEGMEQGEIKVSVTGYKDDSGNIGEELTNSNITGTAKSIILDTIKPKITFDDNKASGIIEDTNLDKYLGRKMKETVNDHIGTFSSLKGPQVRFDYSAHGDGDYTIYAYDKAGNETISKITVTSGLGGDESLDDEQIVPPVVSEEDTSDLNLVDPEVDSAEPGDVKEPSVAPEENKKTDKTDESAVETKPNTESKTTPAEPSQPETTSTESSPTETAPAESTETAENQQTVEGKQEVQSNTEVILPEAVKEVVDNEDVQE